MQAKSDHLPTVMPTSNRPQNVGASMNDDTSRLDGAAKVTGRAKYGRDMYLPEGLFAAFIRCPFGAADLESTDEAAAKAVPGVVEIEMSGKEGKYHGHPVGYMVAENPAALRRGLRALKPVWKRKPVKTRIDETAGPPPEPNDDATEAIKAAELVLEAEYSTAVQTHCSLETHGCSVDHDGSKATVYSSTQGTFAARDGLDEALGLPQADFKVICEYVGGGFGSKLNGPGKEGVTASKIAAKHKRPVYLFCSRSDDQLDTGNRPSALAKVKMGFKKDGTILGGQISTWGGVGVGRGGGGMAFPSGRYEFGKVQKNHADVSFSAGSPRPFRAPGHPQAAFVEELMLDEIATMAKIDPLDLRLKLDDDEDRREMMRLGAQMIGWSNRQPTGSQKGLFRRGFGMGGCTWHRGPARAEAEVVINRDGSVEARTGTQDIGTGQRTIMGIVAADTLGVPLAIVSVRIGDSTLPIGPGSGGSVTAPNTCPAMELAAKDAKGKLLDLIAQRAGAADASEFDIVVGAIKRNGKDHASWKEACALLGANSITGRGQWGQQQTRDDKREGHSHGVQFAEVEIDSQTGQVRARRIVAFQACGRVVCRKTAESQIIGGVIQGVSFALFEDRILDRNVGSMLNDNLEMYKILGSADMPHIEPVLWTKGQVGVRSIGEPPTVPTAGAIACAVFNAIGRPVRHLPITPDKVLAALEGGAA